MQVYNTWGKATTNRFLGSLASPGVEALFDILASVLRSRDHSRMRSFLLTLTPSRFVFVQQFCGVQVGCRALRK